MAKRYTQFTKAQQEAYEALNKEQRAYIDYINAGQSKSDAYKLAYNYGGRNPSQSAYMLEKRNPIILDLLRVLQNQKLVDELDSAKEGELQRLLEVKAKQDTAEKLIEKVEGADSEDAQRIQFYRDIINGKIKSKKVTRKFDNKGKLIYRQEVEGDDIAVRMQARKSLDAILGLNNIDILDKVSIGGITVEIVDATKKAEIPKSEDNIDMNFVDVPEEEVESDE